MTVRCGNRKHDLELTKVHHHDSVAEVRLCYSLGENKLYSHEEETEMDEWNALAKAEVEAEQAIERYYENLGFWEARAEEDRDRELGMGFAVYF